VKAGILHHDVSLANLMVRSDDHSVGVLIDLDIAVRIKDGDRNLPFKPVPGGTIPFRAVELCHDGPATKLFYRYDLESFFYVLIWILTYSETGFSKKRHTLEDWHKGGWRSSSSGKRALMSTNALLPLGPLRDAWLAPLRRMFDEGFEAESRAIGTDNNFNASYQETLDGTVTYERFISIITE
jgi:serine/threonine protein kinase